MLFLVHEDLDLALNIASHLAERYGFDKLMRYTYNDGYNDNDSYTVESAEEWSAHDNDPYRLVKSDVDSGILWEDVLTGDPYTVACVTVNEMAELNTYDVHPDDKMVLLVSPSDSAKEVYDYYTRTMGLC